ncbi:hypothetical protein BP6252_09893 [Coleophoma cylindrospora]|uniref:FAM192A/Fyv6 N-terminal domain-containing protein n=1 Tax=Coleophoma cylindrospora TaxID=1849047 RepID=A0A3D8QX44_9HELO|nr:hypothetical protein BP6252_09893 [Coleophoma cylindrospora]
MSSGFVSGGTADAPVERSDEWLAARQEIEANIARKAIEARQSDGRSLFETLEANKAAKQEAFEEANRLKNQFRALDEDEVEFLDSVLESTRAEEERVRKETAEGLALFRRQQDEVDKKARAGHEVSQDAEIFPAREDELWTGSGRKRKRVKDKESFKGVKIRRGSTVNEPSHQQIAKPLPATTFSKSPASGTVDSEGSESAAVPNSLSPSTRTVPALMHHPETTSVGIPPAIRKPSPPAKVSLGLVEYGSDSDDD